MQTWSVEKNPVNYRSDWPAGRPRGAQERFELGSTYGVESSWPSWNCRGAAVGPYSCLDNINLPFLDDLPCEIPHFHKPVLALEREARSWKNM